MYTNFSCIDFGQRYGHEKLFWKKFYDQTLFWFKKTLTTIFIILLEMASKIGF